MTTIQWIFLIEGMITCGLLYSLGHIICKDISAWGHWYGFSIWACIPIYLLSYLSHKF